MEALESNTERDCFFTKSDKLSSLDLEGFVAAPNERNSNESASAPVEAVPRIVNGAEKPPVEA